MDDHALTVDADETESELVTDKPATSVTSLDSQSASAMADETENELVTDKPATSVTSLDSQSASAMSGDALHEAASSGDIETVKSLLEQKVDVNARNQRGETALHCSAEHCSAEVASELVANHVELDAKNAAGETALHIAARQNDVPVAEILVHAGADLSVHDQFGSTAIHVACSRRSIDVAHYLLNSGCALDHLDDSSETALHKACRENLLTVVQTMCAYGCPVDQLNKAGQSALHVAARFGNAEIVRCLLLSEADADLLNKDGVRAEDIAQGQGHTEVADLLAKFSASVTHRSHDPYIKQLLPTNSALWRIKIKLFGSCEVGKSTLINSLKCGYIRGIFRQLTGQSSPPPSRTPEVDIETGDTEDRQSKPAHPGCTPCVDVQNVNISGVGDVSVWEFSGHDSYYSVYDHFVGDPNCVHVVVFKESDPVDVQLQHLHFWLNFLRVRMAPAEPVGFAGIQLWAPRVLLVATHSDQSAASLRRNAHGETEFAGESALLTSLQTSFGAELLIVPRIFVVDSRQATGADMKALRTAIGEAKQFLCHYLPPSIGFLEATVAALPAWTRALGGFPVVRWSTFVEYVRSKVNILATENHLQELICQLQLMGEIVYIETEADDIIVLNPRWLCTDVLGTLLSANQDAVQRRPKDGRLSADDVTAIFPGHDIVDLVSLLVGLEICSVVAGENDAVGYQFSCFNVLPSSSDAAGSAPNEAPAVCGGILLTAPMGTGSQMRYVFARIQQALWNSPVVRDTGFALREWLNGSLVTSADEGTGIDTALVVMSENGEGVRIECRGTTSRRLFQLQEDIATTIYQLINSCCPGLYIERSPISPRQLQSRTNPPSCYAPRDINLAQLRGKSEVQLEGVEDAGETLVDVLAFGSSELYSEIEAGIDLHVSFLPMYARCRLAALLDPPHPLGHDWCLLALGLGLSDAVPRVDGTDTVSLSRTDGVLAMWSRDSNATVRKLYESVAHSLQRADVEDVLLSLTPLTKPAGQLVTDWKLLADDTSTQAGLAARRNNAVVSADEKNDEFSDVPI